MSTATGVYHTSYRSAFSLWPTTASRVRLVAMLAFLVLLPFVVDPYWLSVANTVGIAAIGAIGLNLLTGNTGLVSLGQAGFLAVGAYTSGLLIVRLELPAPVTLIAAILLTSAVGAVFALPALRLRGLYLAIASLAAQIVILFVIRKWTSVTGGTESIYVPPPDYFGLTLDDDFRWYWCVLALGLVSAICARNLLRSSVGRAFIAIRDQDIAAQAVGIPIGRYKVLAFAVSSGFVGLSGALIGQYRIITWERFTLGESISYLAMVIVGGLGSVLGSVLGAAFIIILPAVISRIGLSLREAIPSITTQIPAIQLASFGLAIVLFLIFEPAGLARIWERAKTYFRLWPFRY